MGAGGSEASHAASPDGAAAAACARCGDCGVRARRPSAAPDLQPRLPRSDVVHCRLRERDAVCVRGADVLERIVAHAAHAALPVRGDHDAKVLLLQRARARNCVLARRQREAANGRRLQVLQRRDDEAVGQLGGAAECGRGGARGREVRASAWRGRVAGLRMCEGGRQPQAWWGGMRCAKCAPADGDATRTSPAGCCAAHRAAAATARLLPTTSASSARDARDRGTMAAAPHAACCVRRAPPSLGHTRGCACVAFARCRCGPPCGSACARDTPAGRVVAGSRVFERCAPGTGARASRAAAPGLARLLHQVRPS